MAVEPVLEMIEQLRSGDLPLPVIRRLFESDEYARKVFGVYLNKGFIVFAELGRAMLLWDSLALLRDPEPLERHEQVRVSLTDYGASAFEGAKCEPNWHLKN